MKPNSFAASAGGLLSVSLLAVLALPAHAEVSLTPRAAYYFDNTNQRQSAIDYSRLTTADDIALQSAYESLVGRLGGSFAIGDYETAAKSSQLAFPQFGGTLTWSPASREGTQYAFTALYGRTSTTSNELIQRFRAYSVLGLLIRDTQVTSAQTGADYARLDLEATLQRRLNESFSLMAGVRAERRAVDGRSAQASAQSYHLYNAIIAELGLPLDPVYQTAVPRSTEYFNSTAWTYSARAGAAAFVPVNDRHLFYVNGLLQLSHQRTGNLRFTNASGSGQAQGTGAQYQPETTLGPDISVGYLYRVSDRVGIDVRYRATVYFTVKGPSDFKDSRVNHGLGVGVTAWLGRR